MFVNKHRDKFRLEKKSPSRISRRWKFVIAGLIGSGSGLLFLSTWSPGSEQGKSTTTGNPNARFLGRLGRSGSEELGKTMERCEISGCATVTCGSISESENPGEIASGFINQEFAVQCWKASSVERLEFQSCTFPHNELGADWLTAALPIRQLAFEDCGLEDLPEGSFSSDAFSALESLAITAARVRVLKKRTFEELTNLKQFLLSGNAVEEAEIDLLSPVADSLEDLGLDASLTSVKVLENMTGRASLTRVKNLYLRWNFLGTIPPETFKSLPNVAAIHLTGSSISEMHVDSFKGTRSLETLFLNDNLLTSLPRGIFDPVLLANSQFKVSLSNNQWRCSCDFDWILYLLNSSREIFMESPRCSSPERNAFLYFTSAKFCDDSNPDVGTSLGTTAVQNVASTEAVETSRTYVKFTCQMDESARASTRKLFATEEWKFPSRHPDFAVRCLEGGDLEVSFKAIEGRAFSLIWFENDATSDDSTSKKIGCRRNVAAPFLLKSLASNSTYTVCLLDNFEESPSPLNCLAARTFTLAEDDKSVVISVAVGLFLIGGVLSALSSFFLLRKNPSLLRGSKRILMVKKRGIDALVLPKGANLNYLKEGKIEGSIKSSKERRSKTNFESSYLMPLRAQRSIPDRKFSCSPVSPPRRKDSKVSRVSSLYSTGSYVSGIEATPSELYNWRNTLASKSLYAACFGEDQEFDRSPATPPPLPLRTFGSSVPSLSLAIDSDNHSDTLMHF
ncbi:uncharacterized protein [Venturia canescens]|uniref:uncharacterized protein n=1 Tax=Venturia canescens TaxID=32260 RepID=UPI001C9BEB74|nr:uncharacterized protein LOC122415257 [Venturia canescens]